MTTTLVLLPGFDGTGELYAPLLDVSGFNNSTVIITYSAERAFNDYVETVIARLPQDNVVLIAESFSGPIALAVAQRVPEKIKGLILCATFASSPFRCLTRLAWLVPEFIVRSRFLQKIILELFCFDRDTSSSLVSKAASLIQTIPAHVSKSRLHVLSELNMYSMLSEINMPVLYLQAEHDMIVAAGLSNKLVAGLGNVTVKKINGPHLLFQARPEVCAESINSFLAALR